MNAVVLTEHEWIRVENRVAMARSRKTNRGGRTDLEPVETTVIARVGHVDPACKRARGAHIVARDVGLETREAGWPCSACVTDDMLATYPRPEPPDPSRVPPTADQAADYGHLVAAVTVARSAGTLTLASPDVWATVEATITSVKTKGEWHYAGLHDRIERGRSALKEIGQ